MYSVVDYGRMAADPVRMDAFARAIRATVKPGATVLDIGAGTGIMTLLALRAGARHVHAVEPNEAVWLIPDLARDNGFAGRVTVHQASSLDMAVPEPIDVVVSDMRGALPLLSENLAALIDVRQRWLAPGGVILPAHDELRVSVVEATAMANHLEASIRGFEQSGFDAQAMRRIVRNQAYSDGVAPIPASDVLSTVETWTTLDYANLSTKNLEGSVVLDALRGGRARGLALHFDTQIFPGIGYTTAPGHSLVYQRAYLPFLDELAVLPGDRFHVTVRADARGERFAWETRHERDGAVLSALRQSTFFGTPASLEAIVRGSEGATPKLGASGERLRQILGAMDGTRTLREIAAAVAPADERVLETARNVAVRYGV